MAIQYITRQKLETKQLRHLHSLLSLALTLLFRPLRCGVVATTHSGPSQAVPFCFVFFRNWVKEGLSFVGLGSELAIMIEYKKEDFLYVCRYV